MDCETEEISNNQSSAIDQLQGVQRKTVSIGDRQEIVYVQNIFSILQNEQLPFQLTEKEDIIKDIYEGGFKVWECTLDLLQWLQKTNFDFSGKNVMDLGCGHGLLGIYSMQKGAKLTLFQDFNIEVLNIAVRLNLILNNIKQEALSSSLIFLSGEWNNLHQKVIQQINEVAFLPKKVETYPQQFDVLMLSEVIYNQSNYEKVANLIIQLLNQNGVCLLANKLYYFGVGGSMPEFKQYITTNYANTLKFQSLEIVNNKKGNKREIIAVTKI